MADDKDLYWGEIPRQKMIQLIEESKIHGWEKALHLYLKDINVEFYDYVVDESRACWWNLLPNAYKSENKVLDIGAGWGTISFALASKCKFIVALEGIYERAKFIQIRKCQDSIDNLSNICASALSLPFRNESFDIVILNGVLEWVGLWGQDSDPQDVQKLVLKNIFKVLKPGGALYLAIENRYGLNYFFGYPDNHSGLRFTTLMPRKLASFYLKLKRNCEYRTYTYSYQKYKSLLIEAGFDNSNFYAPLPTYRKFDELFWLEDNDVVKFHLQKFLDSKLENIKGKNILKIIWSITKFFKLYGFVKYFVPDYSIVAIK